MTELQHNDDQPKAPSPFIAVGALALLLVGGVAAFFVLGGKVPAGPAHGEPGHVHGPGCAHDHGEPGHVHGPDCDHAHGEPGHVHDENCEHAHGEEGHVHDENCEHEHGEPGHVHDENCDHEHEAETGSPAPEVGA